MSSCYSKVDTYMLLFAILRSHRFLTNAPHGLRFLIEDYPYAVDGLEIWFSLKTWVSEYLSLYYKDDASVRRDKELQAWWDEIVNVGHRDLKDDPSRWYKMDSVDEAIKVATTII